MNTERQLGFWSAVALVVANMIGTGVFTTSGFLLGDLKSPWGVLLVWVIGGLLATLGALSYGALAKRIPESGGEYLFLSRTLHPAAGYVAGWLSLLVGFSAPLAAAAFAFGKYSEPWLGGLSPLVGGSILLVIFSFLHALHVRRGAWVQNAAVGLKVLLILMFVAMAIQRLPPLPAFSLGDAPISLFGISLVWVSFSYSGWNAAIYIGGEIRDAERNLPRALLAGTGLVMALYLALNAVFVFAAPVSELAGKVEVGRVAANALGGQGLGKAVSAMVALVLVSSVSSMVMAGPRVYAKMAADGFLPWWLAPRQGPPRASIALQCILALVLLWSSSFDSLLTYIGFTLGLSTVATVVGLVRLRWREGKTLAVPGWPWVPALFLAGVTAMTLFSIFRKPKESAVGLLTIGVGWFAWWFSRHRAAKMQLKN
jgi:basic amino acid/polyamine antiporter, APA family